MPSDVRNQLKDFQLWREAQGTRARSRMGGIYYLLAWVLCWLLSATPQQDLRAGALFTASFTVLFALRFFHELPSERDSQDLRRWIDLNWILILLSSASWGLAFAYILHNQEFQASRGIAMISTVAVSTVMAFTFCMRKNRAMFGILLIIGPALFMLAGQDGLEHRYTLITLAFYLSYLFLALKRCHQEFIANLAMEHELMQQKAHLDWISRTDSLTQLGNRYQFNDLFTSLAGECKRNGLPLSLVLLDIDFFKRINDRHGHAGGDACLRSFAQLMRETFKRDSDALLRLGGEEFGVLMPGTTLEQAEMLAELFRARLEKWSIDFEGETIQVTSSAGVGCLDIQRHEPTEEFFKRVDGALYKAKAEGRNRTVRA